MRSHLIQRTLVAALLLCVPVLSAALTVQYEYDKEHRVTRATYSSGEEIAYTYDAAGNVLSETVTGSNARGTVQVRVTPPTASWAFTDSTGVQHTGTGNQDVTNVPVGRVDVFWKSLSGMRPPVVNPAFGVLSSGAALTLQGIYSVAPTAAKLWHLLK
jgi:YD repeat-containing protein